MKFSATTVMLPEHDLRETAELLAGYGVDGIEWRCRHIPEAQREKPLSPWGNVKNDLSPANLATRGAELRAVSDELGVAPIALATNMAADELDDVRAVAEGCARYGIPMFRLGAPKQFKPAEQYRRLLDDTIRAFGEVLAITAPLGVKAILEIHRGTVACSASQAYLVASHFDPAHLGVIYDVANMSLGEGSEPVPVGLDLLGDYVAHVHLGGGRPVAGERGEQGQLLWKWETCDLRDSILDVPAFLRELHRRDYDGYLSIEDFRPLPPDEKIAGQLAWLKELAAGLD